MKYALFLGCTIPARSRNYELSARRVAEKLGMELIDIPEFICCGFPIRNSERNLGEILAAYNLCLAQDKGLDICTLCSSCTSALTETARCLSEDEAFRAVINKALAKVGLEYRDGPRLKHMARIIHEDIPEEELKKCFEKDLSDLHIAIHYGCHYLKPSKIYDHFDEVESPTSIDRLVALTGAEVVVYPGSKRCCGGPVLPVDEKVALSITKNKLDEISRAGADAICLVCPFCSVMYDGNQKSIESEYEVEYGIPVLYLTQILGLAMGFERKELGLNMNVVKTKQLLEAFF